MEPYQKLLTGVIVLMLIFVGLLGFNIFITWNFCSGDTYNLARFFWYQINVEAYCYYGIIDCVALVLAAICVIALITYKTLRNNRQRYDLI